MIGVQTALSHSHAANVMRSGLFNPFLRHWMIKTTTCVNICPCRVFWEWGRIHLLCILVHMSIFSGCGSYLQSVPPGSWSIWAPSSCIMHQDCQMRCLWKVWWWLTDEKACCVTTCSIWCQLLGLLRRRSVQRFRNPDKLKERQHTPLCPLPAQK